MNFKVENSQITFSFDRAAIGKNDCISGHDKGLRIQLYWPTFKIKNLGKENRNHKELFIRFETVLRLVKEDNYYGFGIQFLGFGFAFDYEK